MTTYARVRFTSEDGPAATAILRDPAVHGSDGTLMGRVLVGVEVDREGDEVASRGVDERVRIISTSLVSKQTPLVMDRLTGLLTEPGDVMVER